MLAPLGVDAFRSDDVVVRVTHAACFRRGLEVHVSAWVRPGSQPRRLTEHHHWGVEEPRVGIRLADGTRLGHRHPHAPMAAAQIDLAALREAAEHEGVLWDPPPAPDGEGFGWFAYAPMAGSAYRSQLAISMDNEGDGAEPGSG